MLKTLSEQLNAIPMGLLPQKTCIENIKQNLEHTGNQAILLKIHSRQLNVIPMGFSRQKFCIENPYSKYQTESRAPTRKQVFKLLKIENTVGTANKQEYIQVLLKLLKYFC